MKVVGPIAVALALLLTGIVAPMAGAKTLTASGGGVHAKLTFTVNKKMRTISRPTIAISQRGGASYRGVVYERQCGSGYCSDASLTLASLDGAHEAVVSFYTGGAHCCTLARVYR